MANASNRITHVLLVLVLFALLAVIGMLATTARGGPLDPPAAPGSTDSVRRPGTPISSLPFVINQSGNYYLTRNLTGAPGTTGIAVNASSVTIDLGGFTLAGATTTGAGIQVTQYQYAIRVTNGNLFNWGTAIALGPAVYSRVDNVNVLDAQNVGIDLGPGSVLEDCNVSSGANEGVRLGTSTMRDCLVFDQGTSGVTVFSTSSVHDNLVLQNNLNAQSGYADIRIEGNESLLERNRVGSIVIVGDQNLLDANMVYEVNFGAQSSGNNFVRGGFCAVLDSGTVNYHPTYFIGNYEDTGSGHLAIRPERNVC